MSKKTARIGIVGCGTISRAYLRNAARFPILNVACCADIVEANATSLAREFGIEACSADELFQADIDIVLNLTIPKAHASVNLRAIESGKHVFCEKPLALDRAEGRATLDAARERNVLVGCAPDTFLGGGLQTSRKAYDDGWIGEAVAGTAFMMGHGHESWHPNPSFFYQPGGGPMFDMGPYFVTALISTIGPVKSVTAHTSAIFAQRTATCKERMGEVIDVNVPTHYTGFLEFVNGAVITMTMSFDVWRHSNHPIELHGTQGSMKVPDPNSFGGPVHIFRPGISDDRNWREFPLAYAYTSNSRSLGLADMAYAIKDKRPPRCSGELAYHVLDVMCAFEESSRMHESVEIASSCDRPQPLPLPSLEGQALA